MDGSSSPHRGAPETGIDLYWLPLGADGHFVRLNGRLYERLQAHRERRRPLDLYHSALEVRMSEGRFVIETAWPIPDADPASRGAVVEGPVGSRRFARTRLLRYEVRRWRDGSIPDIREAVGGARRLSDDPHQAHRVVELVSEVPALVWGRDELGVGDMWSSNSVIAWLLTRAGVAAETIRPPQGGRAPGWKAGCVEGSRRPAPEHGETWNASPRASATVDR